MMSIYDQMCDEGREQDRAEMFARAEAQILDELADAHAIDMQRGAICSNCGRELAPAAGMPALCLACANQTTATPAAAVTSTVLSWYAGERYFANAYDAEITRRRAAEKAAREKARRERLAVNARDAGAETRVATYEEHHQQPARGAKLAIVGKPAQSRGVYWGVARRKGIPTLFAIDSSGRRVAEVAFGPSVEAVDAIEGIWTLLDAIDPIDQPLEAA